MSISLRSTWPLLTCCHEEICHIILSFLTRVLDQHQLAKVLTGKNDGLLNEALGYAITDENVKRVEFILKSVKWQMGQNSLLELLKSDFHSRWSGRDLLPLTITQSMLAMCIVDGTSKQLFPTVVEIIVSSGPVDSNIKSYYKDLSELILRDCTKIELLERIDVGTLREIVSLNGIVNWTKRILYPSGGYGDYDHLLSNRFLEMLKGSEPEQLLDTITQIGERGSSYRHNMLGNSDLVSRLFRFVCLREELDANLWVKRLMILSPNREHIYRNIKSLPMLVEVIHGIPFRQELLDEVTQIAKEHAQKMIQDMFFSSTPNPEFIDLLQDPFACYPIPSPACRLLKLFNFWLDYGNIDQLEQFVPVLTADRNWEKKRMLSSMWALWWCQMCEFYTKEMAELLKRFSSEKAAICGRDAVKKLLLHEIENIPFVVKLVLKGIDVRAEILVYLSIEHQQEMENYFRQNVPKLIEESFIHPETYFKDTNNYGRLNILRFFLDYADENQLRDFIKNITSIKCLIRPMDNTIWNSVTKDLRDPIFEATFFEIHRFHNFYKKDMGQFVESVKEKLGQDAVMKLAMPDDGKRIIIDELVKKNTDVAKTMIACLDSEKRREVLLQAQNIMRQRATNKRTP